MGDEDLRYRPGLNQVVALGDRLASALDGAHGLDLAVAYAKVSGTGELLRSPLPRSSRAVVGLGFGLTDPPAVEQMSSAGAEVRCVVDSQVLAASQFHPKLYLASRQHSLVVLSGSGNLTGGGLRGNVEQYEELRLPDPSPLADDQRGRFEQLWDHGVPLRDLRRSGDWEEYRQRARDRRLLEREDRRRVLRLDRTTGRLVGRLARAGTRRGPGYVGITNPDWWALQLALRDQVDRALFWRKNVNNFSALARGGLFFHLVKHPGGQEDLRSIEGFSTYPGVFETAEAEDLWRRYGRLLGVERLQDLYDRLDVEPHHTLGVIHLEDLVELDRPVSLAVLRASGIRFARNIVSGRGLTLDEVALILELGGLEVEAPRLSLAAEPAVPYLLDRPGLP